MPVTSTLDRFDCCKEHPCIIHYYLLHELRVAYISSPPRTDERCRKFAKEWY